MAKKRSGMGKRGLSALIEGKQKAEKHVSESRVEKLPIDQIQPGVYQPRQHFDEEALQDLAESIKQQGLVQPVVVKAIDEGQQYEIVAGERRWRAAKLAGLKSIDVIIKKIDDQATIAMALVENLQREDLNPIETAMGIKRFMKEFELSQKEVAEILGRSRTGVTNLLRLLKLPDSVQNALHEGEIMMGHARAIVTLPEPLQIDITEKIKQRDWSVRQTEQYVQQLLLSKPATSGPKVKESDQWVAKFEEQQTQLRDKLSAPIKIKAQKPGKGKIEIPFDSEEKLEQLLALLTPSNEEK